MQQGKAMAYGKGAKGEGRRDTGVNKELMYLLGYPVVQKRTLRGNHLTPRE